MNTLVALCAVGAEKILGNEIQLLGYKRIATAAGRVMFTGDDDALYRANLCLRTADRVYLLLAHYVAADFDTLFDGVYAVPWQDFLRKDSRVVVDKVRSHRSALASEHSIQGMVQKAIYQKLGDVWHIQTLPESGEESDVRVYIEDDRALILLDLSGLPLHKRGYRTDGGTAPLRETTAAALLQCLLWRRKTPLHDPFCGSGTIPIEAALYAYNVAPGFGRRFALETLPFFDSRRALALKRAEAEKIRTDVSVHITGTDADPAAIARARTNAEHACVMAGRALNLIDRSDKVPRPDFVVADFRDLAAPFPHGLLLCNPPYGERLGDEMQAEALYRDMASLFTDFAGWQLGVITSRPRFQEHIGRYATVFKRFKAGNLDTTLYGYTGAEQQKLPASDNKHNKGRSRGDSDKRRSSGRRSSSSPRRTAESRQRRTYHAEAY